MYWLVVGTLAVWRVTHLLHAENGPGDVFVRLRGAVGHGFWGRVLDCFHCSSLWVAAPFGWLIGRTPLERGALWLAFSGAAILLERWTGEGDRAPLALPVYYEDPLPEDQPGEEQDNGVLRE